MDTVNLVLPALLIIAVICIYLKCGFDEAKRINERVKFHREIRNKDADEDHVIF